MNAHAAPMLRDSTAKRIADEELRHGDVNMATAAAERQRDQVRRSRARKRNGIVRLTVEVDEADLIGVLRLAKFIGEDERDPEHAELQALLQHVIELWIASPESACSSR